MDKKTRQALEASIEHWKEVIASGPKDTIRIGGSECALCRECFFVDDNCRRCPVYKRTGYENCLLSPYDEASMAHEAVYRARLSEESWVSIWLKHRAFRKAAKKELAFLISLRPEK